jgi:hypothetical protein
MKPTHPQNWAVAGSRNSPSPHSSRPPPQLWHAHRTEPMSPAENTPSDSTPAHPERCPQGTFGKSPCARTALYRLGSTASDKRPFVSDLAQHAEIIHDSIACAPVKRSCA